MSPLKITIMKRYPGEVIILFFWLSNCNNCSLFNHLYNISFKNTYEIGLLKAVKDQQNLKHFLFTLILKLEYVFFFICDYRQESGEMVTNGNTNTRVPVFSGLHCHCTIRTTLNERQERT